MLNNLPFNITEIQKGEKGPGLENSPPLVPPSRVGWWVYGAGLLLAAGGFILDLQGNLGAAAGIPYLVLVCIGYWVPRRWNFAASAALGSVLVLIQPVLTGSGPALGRDFLNRVFVVFALWVTAWMGRKSLGRGKGWKRVEEPFQPPTDKKTSGFRAVNEELVEEVFQRQWAQKRLRESEARIRALLHGVQDPVIAMDETGSIESFNPAAERLFQYQAGEVMGKNVRTLMPGLHGSQWDESLQTPLKSWETRTRGIKREVAGIRKDGSSFPLEIRISEMFMEEKQKFLCTARDLSEQKRTEQEIQKAYRTLETRVKERTADLVRANRKLSQSNIELDSFSYLISHDLKEPLRGIHNFSVFLMEDYYDRLDEEGRSHLETLVRLSRRMEKQINDILYYSRVGRTELNLVPTDLNRVVDEVLDSLQVMLAEKRVAVKKNGRLPTQLCDPVRVQEVFQNLIVNAIKYNDKPEKWVEIGFKDGDVAEEAMGKIPNQEAPSSGPESATVFFVRDNGIGIREKYLDTIFRIFKRLNGRDKFGEGTGVGLTITKRIIDRHNGKIWAESIVGQGTTFYFTLQGEAPCEKN